MRLSGFLNSVVIPVVSIALGGAAAVTVVGSSSEERALLKSRLTEFREFDPDQQKMVRASFAEFSNQTEDRKREIIALHEAIQNDPKLKDGLDRYFAWWSSLSQSEWDSFPEMNREQQMDFAKARINKPTDAGKTIVVDFAGWGQTSLLPLQLTIDECGRIITDSIKDTEIPPGISDEVQQLKSSEHRSLTLSLWLFERFRVDPDREALAVQSENILNAVLANVSDDAWKDQFQQIVAKNHKRSFFKFWMFRNLLVIFDQSTMALGNRLTKQFPVSDDEIVSAFVSLTDKTRQHSLMVMPSDEARTRLQFLGQSNRKQTPEQKLLVKFIAFTRDRQRVIGALTFGLGNRPPQTRDGSSPPRTRDRQ